MTEIAVLTPDAADPSYAGQWPGVLARLGGALATAGLTAVPTAWTDHIADASALPQATRQVLSTFGTAQGSGLRLTVPFGLWN